MHVGPHQTTHCPETTSENSFYLLSPRPSLPTSGPRATPDALTSISLGNKQKQPRRPTPLTERSSFRLSVRLQGATGTGRPLTQAALHPWPANNDIDSYNASSIATCTSSAPRETGTTRPTSRTRSKPHLASASPQGTMIPDLLGSFATTPAPYLRRSGGFYR